MEASWETEGGARDVQQHRRDLHKQNENFHQNLHTFVFRGIRANSGEQGRGLIAAPNVSLRKRVSEVSRQSEDICTSISFPLPHPSLLPHFGPFWAQCSGLSDFDSPLLITDAALLLCLCGCDAKRWYSSTVLWGKGARTRQNKPLDK